MAQNNFRLTVNPLTGEKLSAITNKMYFDSYNGSDDNDGSTATKAKKTLAVYPGYVHLLHGTFDSVGYSGNINGTIYSADFIGDGYASMSFLVNITSGDQVRQTFRFYDVTIPVFYDNHPAYGAKNGYAIFFLKKCTVNSFSFVTGSDTLLRQLTIKDSVVKNFLGGNFMEGSIDRITFDTFSCDGVACNSYIKNSIINNSIDLYTTSFIPIFDYVLIRKQAVWKWNGIVIDMNWSAWVDEATSGTLLSWVKVKLAAYATANSLTLLASIVDNSFRSGCKVVDDSSSAPIRLYNCYDADGVTPNGNYSLVNTPTNPGVFSSDTSFYVGGMYPSMRFVFSQTTKKIIDNSGVEIAGTADLISIDNDDKMYLNSNSSQVRNKISTAILSLPQGQRLNSFSAYFVPSTGALQYYGMLQGLKGGTITPINCLLIEPYDTAMATTPSSTLKKLFVPFNSDALLAVYSVSTDTHAAGDYVLFSELEALVGYSTNKSLTEKLGTDLTPLSSAIVTNAIDEWDDLLALSYITSVNLSGLFRYFKAWIIANSNPS